MNLIIAIDGPAAAGKGTLAKAIAYEFNLPYLDTGSLYRAAASRMMDLGVDPVTAAKTLEEADSFRLDLRTEAVSQEASRISAIPEVRLELDEFQKQFSRRKNGAVLDGRDIGTSIAPDASVKLFVTADTEIRAARRFHEQTANGVDLAYHNVLTEMRIRDERDSSRSVSPLRPADDAFILDTSFLTSQEVREIGFGLVGAAYHRKIAA